MGRARATAAFVYDFLADDGWEILVGVAIALVATLLIARFSPVAAAPAMAALIAATLLWSLIRQVCER